MAKRKVRLPHWYYCEVYRVNVYYFLGWDWEEFKDFILKQTKYEVDKDEAPDGFTVALKGNLYVWTRDKTQMHIYGHECLHACNFILDKAGVRADFSNDEAQAYLLTNIMLQGLK